MQTIYIDVLIVLNLYVNFFLLRTAAGLTHSPLKKLRCIAASLYGSLYSLLILAPELPTPISVSIRTFAAITITGAAFGFNGRKRLLINTGAFFISNSLLAGLTYAVYSFFASDKVHFNNSYFYIDFSLLILVITTAALYGAVYVCKFLFVQSLSQTGDFVVIVRHNKRIIELPGFADTGNSLTDYYSGAPVIVCGKESFPDLALTDSSLPRGVRLIPCSTVTSSGLMPVFRADEVIILNRITGTRKPVDAIIGIGNSSGKAIFNPVLLKY